jgi:hypothetical protein
MGTWKRDIGDLIDDNICNQNYSSIYKQVVILEFLKYFNIER